MIASPARRSLPFAVAVLLGTVVAGCAGAPSAAAVPSRLAASEHRAVAVPEPEANVVGTLLADLEGRDFDRAYPAAQQLGRHPAFRDRIVPALIDAITRSEWNRCGGDVRDAIARSLGELGAREAVGPLLEVVKRGKPIEHECVE